ncbi:MAG: hypothetical protein WA151_02245 [Desulfatirhabdiaceae bacterium]
MADWPNIESAHPDLFSQKLIKPKHKSEMSSGRLISRAKFTGYRWEFTLGWEMIPDADYETLYEFFDTAGGDVFNWTHIKTSVVYECIFLDDEFPEAKPYFGHWALNGLRIGER